MNLIKNLFIAAVSIGLSSRVLADTLTCFPDQGGVEAEIVIEGQDFGLKKGKVKLGGESCLVKSWTATSITARTPRKLKTLGSKYDLQVIEKNGEVSLLAEAFELIDIDLEEMPSSPDDYVTLPAGTLHYVAGSRGKRGRTFSVNGEGFGGNRAKVFVSGPDGKEKPCSISKWSDGSIECIIPKQMEKYESLSVRIENKQGSITHEDLVSLGKPEQLLGTPQNWTSSVYASGDTHEISFKGYNILFYGGWKDDWACFEVNTGGIHQLFYTDLDNKRQTLYMTGLWPLVMDNRLYLFFKGRSRVECLQLDSGSDISNPDSYIWRLCDVPDCMPVSGNYVPVYDQQNHKLYVFDNSSGYLYMQIADINEYFHRSRVLNWDRNAIASARWHSGGGSTVSQIKNLVLDPAACMAFNPKANATQPMVAWRNNDELWYGFLEKQEDGDDRLIIDSIGKMNDINTSSPFLISCGDGSAAMTYISSSKGKAGYCRLFGYFPENPKNNKEAWQAIPYIDFLAYMPIGGLNQDRPPRLSVPMRKGDDNKFYTTLWFYRSYGSYEYGSSLTNLGTVTPEAPGEIIDWATLNHEDPLEWYWDCPVLGVIDGGPPFCNIDPASSNKNELVFSKSDSVSQTWDFQAKGGFFLTWGPPPVVPGPTGELHAGVSTSFTQEITKTLGIDLKFPADPLDNDSVWVLFLVPKTRCTKLNYSTLWGNIDYCSYRNCKITQVDVSDVNIHAVRFPRSNFTDSRFPASRKYGDLASYGTTPLKDDNGFLNTGKSTSWGTGLEATLRMSEQTVETKSAGIYFSFKVGYGVADVISGGLEGEISETTTLKKTKETSVSATIINNRPLKSGDVNGAAYTAYWFGTKEGADDDCYWVPKKRSGYGDLPFFITYLVSNIQIKK